MLWYRSKKSLPAFIIVNNVFRMFGILFQRQNSTQLFWWVITLSLLNSCPPLLQITNVFSSRLDIIWSLELFSYRDLNCTFYQFFLKPSSSHSFSNISLLCNTEPDLTEDNRKICLGIRGTEKSLLKLIKLLNMVILNLKARVCRHLDRRGQDRALLHISHSI